MRHGGMNRLTLRDRHLPVHLTNNLKESKEDAGTRHPGLEPLGSLGLLGIYGREPQYHAVGSGMPI